MPYTISQTTVRTIDTKEKDVEAMEARVITSLNHLSQAHATIVVPIRPKKCKAYMGKNAFTATSKVTSLNFAIQNNVVNLLV